MMKKVVIGILMVVLIAFPVYAVDDVVITDIDIVSDEALIDFDVDEDVYEVTLAYETNTISLEVSTDLVDLSGVDVTVDETSIVQVNETENDVLLVEDVVLTLTNEEIKNNEYQEILVKVENETEVLETYKIRVYKDYILKDLTVHEDVNLVDLLPEFDSIVLDYQAVVKQGPVHISFELLSEDYRAVYDGVDLSFDTNDDMWFKTVLNEDLVFGSNEYQIDIELKEIVEEETVWTLVDSYTVDLYLVNVLGIDVVDETMTPEFDPAVLEYEVRVAHDQTTAVIEVTPNEGSVAEYEVALDNDPDDGIIEVDLDYGLNTVEIVVTEGEAVTYTLNIVRENPLRNISFEFEDESFDLSPEFDSAVHEYDVMIPVGISEVAVYFETDEGVEVFLNDLAFEAGDLLAVAEGSQTYAFVVKKGEYEVTYTFNLLQYKLIDDINILEVPDFEFNPMKDTFVLKVEDLEALTFEVLADEDINVTLVDEDDFAVALEEGRNDFVFEAEYDGVVKTYTFKVYRNYIKKPVTGSEFLFKDLGGLYDDDQLYFSDYALTPIVSAFKWGNNQNNVIRVYVDDDDFELTLTYPIYKFLTQRNVKFEFVYQDGDDDLDYRTLSLKSLKLSRFIGPNHVDYITLEIDLDEENIVEDIDLKYSEFFKNKWNRFDKDDDDDDDDDDDLKKWNNGKAKGKNK